MDVLEFTDMDVRLRQSEQRFRELIEICPDAVFVNRDDALVCVNRACVELFGYLRPEDVLGKSPFELFHPSCHVEIRQRIKTVLNDGKRLPAAEEQILRPDGGIAHVQTVCAPIMDGDRPAVLVSMRDLTQIKERELHMGLALDAAQMGSFELDLATHKIRWSGPVQALFGISGSAFIDKPTPLEELILPEDLPMMRKALDAAARHRSDFSHEFRFRADGGKPRWFAARGRFSCDAQHQPHIMHGVIMDVHERKLADETLRELSQRLRTMSHQLLAAQETERRRLARELHDELGQSLTIIKMSLQMTRQDLGDKSPRSLNDCLEAVERTIHQVRNTALDLRPSILDDLGLADALNWYLNRLQQTAGLRIARRLTPLPGRLTPAVETACFRIAQEALTNIVRHAQATTVEVKLKSLPLGIELVIRDDGRGFDTVLSRQRAMAGSSLGILGMEEWTALAGGTFRIESQLGIGTTIRVRLGQEGGSLPGLERLHI